VLVAELDLFQGALQVIRRRHMARHPSMWPPASVPATARPAGLQVLPL
jgi:hypothetical protein